MQRWQTTKWPAKYLMLKAMTPISSRRSVLVPHAIGVFVSPISEI
jgi:hypothetical protein